MKILNLTQHAATSDQMMVGVVDLQGDDFATLKQNLNFVGLPSGDKVRDAAYSIAKLAQSHCLKNGIDAVMLGGAPFLMAVLHVELQKRGLTVMYAFSERVSVEKEIDGKVIKTNEFKHSGFVEVFI